jgi:SulP family sulfate permease
LPSLTLPDIGLGDVRLLFSATLGIALLAFAEGILTARVFAEKREETLDANQELLAYGAANLGAAFTQGFPIGVSQSWTVVDDDAGGKTQLVGIVAAALVALFLLFFTALLEPLPSVALGAIVTVAALGLIEVGPLRALRRVDRAEFGLALVAPLACSRSASSRASSWRWRCRCCCCWRGSRGRTTPCSSTTGAWTASTGPRKRARSRRRPV